MVGKAAAETVEKLAADTVGKLANDMVAKHADEEVRKLARGLIQAKVEEREKKLGAAPGREG